MTEPTEQKRFVAELRPAVVNGPNRMRAIRAGSLREAQDIAFERYGPYMVFFVHERRDSEEA